MAKNATKYSIINYNVWTRSPCTKKYDKDASYIQNVLSQALEEQKWLDIE